MKIQIVYSKVVLCITVEEHDKSPVDNIQEVLGRLITKVNVQPYWRGGRDYIYLHFKHTNKWMDDETIEFLDKWFTGRYPEFSRTWQIDSTITTIRQVKVIDGKVISNLVAKVKV